METGGVDGDVTPCHRRLRTLVGAALLAVALSGCSQATGEAADVAPSPTTTGERVQFVSEVQPTVGRAVRALEPTDRVRRVTVLVGGDILVHEAVWESARGHAGGDGFDFGPMFASLVPVISAADLALCHLEVPLSFDNTDLATYPRFNAPFQVADAVAGAGFDGCSVASNHTLDQGVAGIDATLGHLDRAGLGHAGAARTPDEATELTSYLVRNHRVAHLSYTYGFNGLRRPAGEEWRANLIDADAILVDAERARAEGADLVLLSIHWGDEYVHAPSRFQVDLAAILGASPDIDLVIGHHAHVVQPVDQVGTTWVAYGLGNLLSNMMQPERRDGVLLVVTFEAPPGGAFEVVAVEYAPTEVVVPGHLIELASAESAARTAAHLGSLGARMTPVGAAGVSQ